MFIILFQYFLNPWSNSSNNNNDDEYLNVVSLCFKIEKIQLFSPQLENAALL